MNSQETIGCWTFHCESFQWTALRGDLQSEAGQVQVGFGKSRVLRHDYLDYYAALATRGGDVDDVDVFFFWGGGWKKINDILVKYCDEMQLKELLVDKIQVTTWYGKTMDKWSETYELQQLGYALVFASPLLRNPSNVQWITPHQLWSILSDCCLPSTSIFLDIFIIV